MPWTNDNLDTLITKARQLLLKEFPDVFTAQVYICTQSEMIDRIKKEITREEFKGEVKRYLARFVIGKYFAPGHVIWLVEGKGETLPTLLHELLHSIQRCGPHRENIVNYVVYKILNRPDLIDHRIREEWEEIEKSVGFKEIKKRFRSEGDCEDF